MKLEDVSIVVVSHAGIKQINRAVYRVLKHEVKRITMVVPKRLQLGSGRIVRVEPETSDDPVIFPFDLSGSNPRTYFYPSLVSWLNQQKPDIILLENDPVSRLGVQLSAWCRKNGAKVICQTYENDERRFWRSLSNLGLKGAIASVGIKMMNLWMASRIDALLVVNKDSESIFKTYGYRNAFRIPLGFDKAVFFKNAHSRRKHRMKMGISDETALLAYFGRLVPQKGVHLLITALKDIRSYNWMLLLDHIHDSEDVYGQEIRRLIEAYDLRDRVIFFEADHFQIADYMRAADVAIAPSITTPRFKEQYGRAVQEAMACGCVCIVSNSGHLKDLVGHPDLVFPEGNVERLRYLLQEFITDSTLRLEYSEVLAKRAAALFSTEAQSAKLCQILGRLYLNDGRH